LGRFDPQKNVEMLLDAMCALPVDIKLILCGKGILETAYRSRIERLRLEERVILPGYLDKEKVWALLQKVRASVLVSHYEGFPNGLIEAMINRCPLVVSDIPPHREFLDETTARFVNKQDPQSIAQGILETLNNVPAAALQADKAFDIAKQFSIKMMADKYEALYDQLLRRRPLQCRSDQNGRI
jgi:glycosyltransferase involved in cell wall biosynthesis